MQEGTQFISISIYMLASTLETKKSKNHLNWSKKFGLAPCFQYVFNLYFFIISHHANYEDRRMNMTTLKILSMDVQIQQVITVSNSNYQLTGN